MTARCSRRIALILFLLTAFPCVVSGGEWEALGPWGGSDIVLKTPDPAGELVYAISRRGIFRSQDRGQHWISLAKPLDRLTYPSHTQFAVTRADPNRIVAIFDNQHAYLSNNQGDSWTLIDSVPEMDGLIVHMTATAIDQVDADRLSVFHGTPYKMPLPNPDTQPLWKESLDAGLSFTETGLTIWPECPADYWGVVAAEYHPNQSGHLFYANAGHCAGTIDFNYRLISARDDQFTDVVSVYAGMSSPLSTPSSAIGFENGNYLWKVGSDFYRISSNDFAVAPIDKPFSGFAADDDVILIAGINGIEQSTDQGVHWSIISNESFGVDGDESRYAVSAVIFEDGDVLASGRDGVFHQSKSSDQWTSRSDRLNAIPISAIEVSPDESRIWVGATFDQTNVNLASAKPVYQSADGGASWQASDLNRFAFSLMKISVDPATVNDPANTIVYAAGYGCVFTNCEDSYGVSRSVGIYRSLDDGATWQSLMHVPNPDAVVPSNLRDLSIDLVHGQPDQRRIYAVYLDSVIDRTLLRTLDSGNT
jgi:hypothetical protein